ncbi:MAG: glycoside hydrolase family 1 protein, partial [Enterobacteriaceae bacterium]
LTAYRFSISWPRLLPEGTGNINPKGLEFYNAPIDELLANDITPLVTIYHFDLPMVLQERYGGWLHRQSIEDFAYYCRILFEHFGDRVKHWFTINEQSNMFALPYLLMFDKESEQSQEQQKYQMNHHMMVAHARATILCQHLIKDARIGPAIGLSPCYPASSAPRDILAAQVCDDFKTGLFMDLYFHGRYRPDVWRYLEENQLVPQMEPGDLSLLQQAKPNLLGINYYQSMTVRHADPQTCAQEITIDCDGKKAEDIYETVPGLYQVIANPLLEKTAWGWDIDPVGLRILLKTIGERYDVPIIITENGIGANDKLQEDKTVNDQYRIDYLQQHLQQIQLAISDGVNVVGYCPWSFIDLLSTTSGFAKRYGFVYVNRTDTELNDLARYKKASFFWYQKVIQQNGL